MSRSIGFKFGFDFWGSNTICIVPLLYVVKKLFNKTNSSVLYYVSIVVTLIYSLSNVNKTPLAVVQNNRFSKDGDRRGLKPN